MKRRRMISIVVFVIVIGLAFTALYVPSVEQNQRLNKYARGLLEAVREKDRDRVTSYYGAHYVPGSYMDLVLQYDLLDWEITKVTGQPWPLESNNGWVTVSSDLYYAENDELLAFKEGYRRVEHPQHGACVLVPIELEIETLRVNWRLVPPGQATKINWLAPYTGPDNAPF